MVELIPLGQALSMEVGNYEAEREVQWHHEFGALGERAWTLFLEVESLANRLLTGAGKLVSLDVSAEARDVVLGMANGSTSVLLARLIRERISIDLGYESAQGHEDAVNRTLQLAALAIPAAPSKRAAAFLERVARCYVHGLMPEAIMLCRSVLDTELEFHIPADDCIEALGQRRSPYFTLDDRIAVAVKAGHITPEAAQDAHEVRRLGNDAVHRQPNASVDAFAVIRKTLDIILQLSQQ